MSSFLTALTSIADQYGQAKNAVQAEKEARMEKFRQMDLQQEYVNLAKQREEREAGAQKTALEQGDLIKVGNRLWSVSKGKFVDTQTVDPMSSLREFVKTLPPDVQKGAASRAQMIADTNPNDPKAIIEEVMRFADNAQNEANRREDKAAATAQREEDRKEDKEFRREMQANQQAFQRQITDQRIQDRMKYMDPKERQMYDSIKQVQPAVDRTIAFLEGTRDSKGDPLKDENSLVFGDRSALMQHLRFAGYKFGKAQEDISQQLIKNAAVIQVLGARPWMTMGRGKFIYETIAQHLPKPTDTPKNLYDKLTWLRDNVLDDARNSLAGYTLPTGGTYNPGGGVDVDKILDQAFPTGAKPQ